MVSWRLNQETCSSSHDFETIYSIITNLGEEFQTRKIVLAVGAWAPEVYGEDIPFNLQVERRVLHWFHPFNSEFDIDEKNKSNDLFRNIPVLIWDNDKKSPFYAFPLRTKEDDGESPQGVKVALHGVQGGDLSQLVEPNLLERKVDDEEIAEMRSVLSSRIPLLSDGKHTNSLTCLYTFTPNEHFLLDWHQHANKVLLVSPCSGHGFKFSSVIGEACTALLTKGSYGIDLSMFALNKQPRSQK